MSMPTDIAIAHGGPNPPPCSGSHGYPTPMPMNANGVHDIVVDDAMPYRMLRCSQNLAAPWGREGGGGGEGRTPWWRAPPGLLRTVSVLPKSMVHPQQEPAQHCALAVGPNCTNNTTGTTCRACNEHRIAPAKGTIQERHTWQDLVLMEGVGEC